MRDLKVIYIIKGPGRVWDSCKSIIKITVTQLV